MKLVEPSYQGTQESESYTNQSWQEKHHAKLRYCIPCNRTVYNVTSFHGSGRGNKSPRSDNLRQKGVSECPKTMTRFYIIFCIETSSTF